MDWLNYIYLIRRWAGIIGRCEYPGHPAFYNYGARGIYVCEEWQDFRNFAMYWKNTFLDTKLQISRINNDGPYSPKNTKPETNKQNQQNKRKRRSRIENKNLDKTYSDLSLKWSTMIQRCYDINNKSYHEYGEKGVFVCDEWLDYRNYKEYFNNKILIGYHVDRIDGNGPYNQINTRIVTAKQNANNRSTNTRITWNNKTLTIAEWATETGLHQGTIGKRYNLGWQPPELFRAVSRQVPQRVEIVHDSYKFRVWDDNGVPKTMTKLSKEYNIPKTTLRYKLVLLGQSLEEALKYERQQVQKLVLDGELKTYHELAATVDARKNGLSADALRSRINRLGWDVNKAISTPLTKTQKFNEVNKLYAISGVNKTLREWSKEPPYIPYKTIFARISLGWTIEDAVSKPLNSVNPLKRKRKAREIYKYNGEFISIKDLSKILKVPSSTLRTHLQSMSVDEIIKRLTTNTLRQRKRKKLLV